jgi:hypothetical protein
MTHFCCAACNEPIGEETYFEKGGKAYCVKDHKALFLPKCAKWFFPYRSSPLTLLLTIHLRILVEILLKALWSLSKTPPIIQTAIVAPLAKKELMDPVSSLWELLITLIASIAMFVTRNLGGSPLTFLLR